MNIFFNQSESFTFVTL